MGSSGGSANPMFLSQGNRPIPGLPIAGQGAPNDSPQNYGSFQSFLPDIPASGQGPASSARGLTSEMFQYRAPGTGSASGEIDSLRQQLAAAQAAGGGGGGGGGGNGQFGAARDDRVPNAQGNPTWSPYGPIHSGYQWVNGQIAGPGAPGGGFGGSGGGFAGGGGGTGGGLSVTDLLTMMQTPRS
jgi:hypothetical protein